MMKTLPALALLATLASCGLGTSPDKVQKLDLVNSAIFSIREVADEAQTFMIRLAAPALVESARYEGSQIIIDETQKALVLKQQSDFVKELTALDPTIRVIYSTKLVMNSITIAASPSLMGKITKLPMVRNARPMSLFSAPEAMERVAMEAQMQKALNDIRTRNSVSFIGALEAREKLGLTGKGLKVGIIDTGVDYTHTMLGGSGSIEEYNSIDATQEVSSFPNKKIVAGIDLVGDDFSPGATLKELRIPKPDKNPLDYNGHGTHVAGTVAGLGDGVQSFDGVASEADLVGIKVFGRDSTGDAVVIAALEYSLDPNGDLDPSDRLDVVNLSLGGGYGKPSINYSEAVKNATRAGLSVVAAAGNSGDSPFIVGAPSTSLEAISVAAGIDDMRHNVQLDAAKVTIAGVDKNVEAAFGSFSKVLADGEVITGKVVFAGLAAEDFSQELKDALKGSVALIDRGVETFENKAKRALDAGAIGVAIANNNDDAPSPPGGSTNVMDIPVLMISKAAGMAMKEALANGADVQFSFSNEFKFDVPELADTITNFSSRGPRSEDGIIKPEIVAPGQQVISADAGKGSAVARLNGTSMASPHMGGVLALMKQRYPTLSVLDHKHILMSTARIIADSKGNRYPVTAQGAGRVDVMKAAQAKLVPNRGAFSLGKMDLLVDRKRSEVLTLKNISDEAVSFRLETDFTPGLELLRPEDFTIAPGASLDVKLNFTLSRTNIERANFEGFVKLVSADGVIANFPVLAVIHQSALVSAPAVVPSKDSTSVVLANASAIKGNVLPFHLMGRDERKPDAGELANIRSRACDLKSAGYRLVKKKVGEEEKSFLQVAVKLYESVSHWQACAISMQIDGNNDGVVDQEWVSIPHSYLPGLATIAPAGFYSVLLDAQKAKDLRVSFEAAQRDSRGEDKTPESYVDAILGVTQVIPLHMTSVSVMEMDLDLLGRLENGDLRIKLAALYETDNAIMPEDFMKNEKWFNVKLPKTFVSMPEVVSVDAFSSQAVELPNQVKRPFVLYVPNNSDGKRDETRDMQEIILR